MDTEKLKILLQIVESGSIQGAARSLGVNRSLLRRSLDGLELEIGAPLVHRDATGVRLTAAGALVVEQGRPLLEATRQLVESARASAGEAVGTLRVIEPVGLPLAMHAQLILTAHLVLPGQRLELRHVENPMAHLHEPFELMLHEGPPPDRNAWFSRVLMRVPLRLIASRAYIERRGAPQNVTELAKHDVLGWKRPGHRAEEWPLLAGGTVPVTPWLSSADPHLLAAVAIRGGGILLAPRILVEDEPGAEQCETVLKDDVGADLVFRVTTPFPARADSRTRDTLELVLEHLEGLPKN